MCTGQQANRVLLKIIAIHRLGTGTTAATHREKSAGAAGAFVLLVAAQAAQQVRGLPDAAEIKIIFRQTACREVKKTAGLNLPRMTYEGKIRRCQTAVDGLGRRELLLPGNAGKLGTTGQPEFNFEAISHLSQLVQNGFVFLGRKEQVADFIGAANRYENKGIPAGSPLPDGHFCDSLHVGGIEFCQSGIKLKSNIRLSSDIDSLEGYIKSAGNLPEGIV